VLGGHSSVVRYLCGNYGQCINSTDHNGRSPLHYAATLSDQGTLYKVLIQSGADPNVKDSSGNTPGVYLRRKDLLTQKDLLEPSNKEAQGGEGGIDKWERPESPSGHGGGEDEEQGKFLVGVWFYLFEEVSYFMAIKKHRKICSYYKWRILRWIRVS
jgi:hypothetical protein